MTSVTPMAMKKRADVVTDGGDAEAIVANAPATRGRLLPRAEGRRIGAAREFRPCRYRKKIFAR